METSTQIPLVLAAQAGDQKAFETLVLTYRRELQRSPESPVLS